MDRCIPIGRSEHDESVSICSWHQWNANFWVECVLDHNLDHVYGSASHMGRQQDPTTAVQGRFIAKKKADHSSAKLDTDVCIDRGRDYDHILLRHRCNVQLTAFEFKGENLALKTRGLKRYAALPSSSLTRSSSE